jgi:ribosomal protein S27E
MSALTATWSITLDTECPACKEDVNLLDGPDFWDGHRFDVPEHGTERTKGVKVVCPECEHAFTVDLEY